jgi:sulfonate transport system substrate-binding protein
MTVRIGVHPSNHTLFVLSHVPALHADLDVEWVRYGGGATTARRIGDGQIDVGGTGSTPPIIGQAAGLPLVYLAVSGPRPPHGELVVPEGSPVHRPADLKGRRVALGIGSWQTQFLAVLLKGAGLLYQDIEPVHTDAGTYEEFAAGELDAWIVGNPPLDRVLDRLKARVLVETTDYVSNRSVFFAARRFAEERREEAAAVVAALQRADAWIAEHLGEAGAIYAEHSAGYPARSVSYAGTEEWVAALGRRPWGLERVSAEFLSEQQLGADVFYEFAITDRPVIIADAVLPDPIPVPSIPAPTTVRKF